MRAHTRRTREGGREEGARRKEEERGRTKEGGREMKRGRERERDLSRGGEGLVHRDERARRLVREHPPPYRLYHRP